MRSTCISYRFGIPLKHGIFFALPQTLLQERYVDALVILGHAPEFAVEGGILEHATCEEVGWRYHPHIPGVNRIRKDLENAGKILTRATRYAYSLRHDGVFGRVEGGEPCGNGLTQRFVSWIRTVEKGWGVDIRI